MMDVGVRPQRRGNEVLECWANGEAARNVRNRARDAQSSQLRRGVNDEEPGICQALR
jgi:hypothetical protein